MKTLVVFSVLFALAVPTLAHSAERATRTPVARASATTPKRAAKAKPGAAKLAASATPKDLTADQRTKLALTEVQKDLVPWTDKGTKVTVRAAVVPFDGDKRNPITGTGPIGIYVTQARTQKLGMFGRIRQAFNPYSKQSYLVNVDQNGDAQILERISLAPQHRFMRLLTNKLALGALTSDFIKSGKLTETLFTAAGATGAAAVSPLLSGALFMRVAQVIGSGISSQHAVRKTAMDQTVAWAQTQGKTGAWPTLMESYREYQANIDSAQAGARPLGLRAFVDQLSINRL